MKCCNLIGQIKVFKSLIPPVIALIPPPILLSGLQHKAWEVMLQLLGWQRADIWGNFLRRCAVLASLQSFHMFMHQAVSFCVRIGTALNLACCTLLSALGVHECEHEMHEYDAWCVSVNVHYASGLQLYGAEPCIPVALWVVSVHLCCVQLEVVTMSLPCMVLLND